MADDNALVIGAGCGDLSVGTQPVCVIPYQEHDGLCYNRGSMIGIPEVAFRRRSPRVSSRPT
jgi:hypothetical protein